MLLHALQTRLFGLRGFYGPGLSVSKVCLLPLLLMKALQPGMGFIADKTNGFIVNASASDYGLTIVKSTYGNVKCSLGLLDTV